MVHVWRMKYAMCLPAGSKHFAKYFTKYFEIFHFWLVAQNISEICHLRVICTNGRQLADFMFKICHLSIICANDMQMTDS